MFRTGSPYSPFFTSGLLSQPLMAPYQTSPEFPLGPRRGSLPTDTQPRSSSSDESASFYFTLQPKRDESEYRSFLSLDLAESQSLRSASLKRKVSNATKATSRSSKYERAELTPCPTIPEVPQYLAPLPSPLRLRHSRDSLRTIPSPKPAPSSTLPDVPKDTWPQSPVSSAPRIPSIPAIPSLTISLPPVSHSAPSSAISPPVSKITKMPQRASLVSQLTSSSVSTRVRKINRLDALACLEGRSKSAELPRVTRPERKNFMSMTDDEDDSDLDSDDDKDWFFAPFEPEASVLPLASPRSSKVPSGRRRKPQYRTTKDWFPLKSFIDLHNDDESSRWSWRSFVEVASLS